MICRPIQHDNTKPSLLEYKEDFQLFQLNELVALSEFLHSPSYLALRKLLEAYRDLPECCKTPFMNLVRRCNWFLQELSDKLLTSESEEDFFKYYDRTHFEACLKKDRKIIDLAETADLVSVTRANYWNEMFLFYGTTIPQELMQEILSTANENNITEGFISFLRAATESAGTISPELGQFSMRYFPLLFQNSNGVELALRLFDQTPLLSLFSCNVEYPKTLQIPIVYSIEEEQTNGLLEKIDHLADLGEKFQQAYALFPFFFFRAKYKLLSKLMPNTVMQYYHSINTTGNQAALLGCILRLLAGPVSDELKIIIWEKLLELLQINSLAHIWLFAADLFSMDGKILVYEAIATLNTDTERISDLLSGFAYAILRELEASPVDRNKLMELSRIAHSDQHFL